jgi:sugar phosphate isomerase/epimerase
MILGIFAKSLPRPTFEQSLDAVAALGLHAIQFNFSCVDLPTLPARVEPGVITRVRRACEEREIQIAGVSATFNLIDPDENRRRENLARLPVIAAATRGLGCELITLCTGTRDAADMWRAHPDNSTPAAWGDLLASFAQAIPIAEQHDVLLGVEPEAGNAVSSARKARQLLDELQSRRVRIVLDAANLFHPGAVANVRDTIAEAFQLLGTEIVMAHAKELAADGTVSPLPPGRGVIEWDYYLDTLARVADDIPLLMHGFPETDVPAATRFLRAKLFD